MRIGTLVRSYGLTKYLRPVLKSYDWVDRLLVLNYRFSTVTPREDKTKEIAEGLGQKNIEVIQDVDYDLHQVLNFGVEKLKNCDAIFIADADELIARSQQKLLFEGFKESSGARCPLIEYAGDHEHIYPIRGHQPIVLIKPDVQFYDVRCAGGAFKSFPDIYVHHFGFAFDKEEMGWKINWERKWEKDETFRIYTQPKQPYTMPYEIREMLNA